MPSERPVDVQYRPRFMMQSLFQVLSLFPTDLPSALAISLKWLLQPWPISDFFNPAALTALMEIFADHTSLLLFQCRARNIPTKNKNVYQSQSHTLYAQNYVSFCWFSLTHRIYERTRVWMGYFYHSLICTHSELQLTWDHNKLRWHFLINLPMSYVFLRHLRIY